MSWTEPFRYIGGSRQIVPKAKDKQGKGKTNDRAAAMMHYNPGSARDASWADVVLLLPGGEAHNSTTYIDVSSNASTVTGSGVAKNDNAQKKWGSTSILCSTGTATLGYITAEVGANGIMAGDFTFEGWFESGQNGVPFFANHGATIYQLVGTVWYNNDAANAAVGSWNLNPAEWIHFAISRTGTTMKFWRDGVLTATKTFAGTMDFQTIKFGYYVPSNNTYWAGHIQDIRLTKNVGRYPNTCTVPTEAFPIG